MKTSQNNMGVPEMFVPTSSIQISTTPQTNLRKRAREHPVPPPDRDTPYNLPHLPDDVVMMILSFMDTKQLAQSVLIAKSFRDSYKLGRRLDFEQPIFKKLARKRLYVSTVSRFIDQHRGPKIQSLKLWFDPFNCEEHWALVAGWINKAAQKGVEEFDFNFCQSNQMFLLPDEVFKVDTLQILRLSFCDFILPIPKTNFAVTGLPCLRVLSFRKMDLEDTTVLRALLEGCSKLETLELLHCCFPKYFKIVAEHLKTFKACKLANGPVIVEVAIEAPNLTTLHYSGPLVVFRYMDFKKLTDCILDFKPHKTFFATESYKLDQVMYDMSNIEVLTTTSRLLEALCSKHSDGENNTINEFYCLSKLKEIQVYMEGSRYCNLFTIASFLGKCPSVEKIHIDCRGWFRADKVLSVGFAEVLEQQSLLDQVLGPCHPNLKELKLTGFKFEPHEMKLLSYFVETGLGLETVAIFLPSPRTKGTCPFLDEDTLNQQLRPRMVSPKGRIRVFQHFEDKMFCPFRHIRNWHCL